MTFKRNSLKIKRPIKQSMDGIAGPFPGEGAERQMEKITASLKNGRTGPLIVAVILVALLIGIPIIVGVIQNETTKTRYVEGDFSDFTCEISRCEDPPTWKLTALGLEDRYYCEGHQEEGRALYERLTGSSDPDTVTCGFCGRSFQAGTENAESILRTNLCSNCYGNFRSAQDALQEMPIGK